MPRLGHLSVTRLLVAVLFLYGAALAATLGFDGAASSWSLMLAALFGAYLALAIGANDAANNLGAVVGSKAVTLGWALIIAMLLEFSGAMLGGSNVMNTIRGSVIDPAMFDHQQDFLRLMLSALLAAALWIHLATLMGAPVSTTHTIIGGMLGAGLTGGGMEVAHGPQLAAIASSWIVSPLLGGVIAAAILYLIKQILTYQVNMTKAAKRVVPLLIAAMAWAFAAYLMLKGLSRVWQLALPTILLSSLIFALGLYLIIQPIIEQAADRLPQSKLAINTLFNVPLVFAAAILSFAHGTNDVANAIGPIVAVYETLQTMERVETAAAPLWISLTGALGLGLGILLYGARLIRVVGSEITELDQIRAYSITMAIALTVILASELGLPVSTTHVAVGAIVGVGFLREYLKKLNTETRERITHHLSGKHLSLIHRFFDAYYAASFLQKRRMLKQLETHSLMGGLSKQERQELNRLYRKELVKRSTLVRIVIIWLLTIPLSGLLASLLYLLMGLWY